jgi:perosamine synthetase
VRLAEKQELAVLGGPRAVPDGSVRAWPRVAPEDKDAVMRVLDREILWGATAPEVTALQKEWAAYHGVRRCLATNSGTASLHMAVAAAGVEPGDEVITTPLSWTSTATCVLHHNAIPIFADIDPATYNIDPESIEAKITSRTRAIIPVHLYGLPADMDAIMAVAGRHGLKVIEDACQAGDAEYNGCKVGSIGHLGCFSFNGNKNLPGGEGGALVTDDEDLWQEAARIQQFGERRRADGEREYNAYGMGWMYRTTEMTAAFVRSQFARIHDITERIRTNAAYLTQNLRGIEGLDLPIEPAGRKHVYFRYVARFAPEQLGLRLKGAELAAATEKIRQALVAEGVPPGRAEFVIPGMTLFQEKRGYGKGCPWTCHYNQPLEYRTADYPNAVDAINTIIPILGLTPPNDEAVMAAFVGAFAKVFAQIPRVLA